MMKTEKGLETVKGVVKDKPVNAGMTYKDIINGLAAVKQSVDDKPIPVWRWPQYASVGVRNKSFSNIDPATETKAGTISDGTTTISSAGTAVQLSATSTPCYRVIVTAHESNTGTVLVGASDVKAALSGRKGVSLYATQSQAFNVNDLNLLWVDSTASSDKVHWYVEKS
jgi:hypothetical protein